MFLSLSDISSRIISLFNNFDEIRLSRKWFLARFGKIRFEFFGFRLPILFQNNNILKNSKIQLFNLKKVPISIKKDIILYFSDKFKRKKF